MKFKLYTLFYVLYGNILPEILIGTHCDENKRIFMKIHDVFALTGILPYVKVVDNFDAEYEYITNEGSVFTFKTNLDSPRYKLININLDNFAQVIP